MSVTHSLPKAAKASLAIGIVPVECEWSATASSTKDPDSSVASKG